MNAFSKIAALLCVAGALVSTAAAQEGAKLLTPASAQHNYYAMVTIENPTNQTLNFEFCWGDDAFESFSLSPGQSRWFSWEYDYADENRSPRPYIQFDQDLSSGFDWELYQLEAYAVPNLNYEGKVYYFNIDWYNNVVDLRSY